MKEYVLLLLITYVIWMLLIKIVTDTHFKNIWIMPLYFFGYIMLNDFFKAEYYLSEELVIMSVLWLVMDSKPKEKLKGITTVLVFSNVLEMIVCIMEKIFDNDIIATFRPEICVKLIYLCILLILYFVKKHVIFKVKKTTYDLEMYMLIWLFGMAVTMIIDYYRYNTQRLYDYVIVLSVSVVFNSILLVVFLIFIIINNRIINDFYNKEKEINEEQKLYYEMLLQKEEETKKFRHDIKNQLIHIRKLAEEEGNNKVTEYMSEISGQVENIDEMVYKTGNKIIDVLLNYYICRLSKGIHIHIKGMLADDICVKDSDLNVIFGNVFKNIYEELEGCDEGYIKVECKTGTEYSCIIIENSLGISDNNDLLKKKKNNNFGYGITNIKRTAKKNNVLFKWEKTDKKYCTELTFKNKTRVK